MPGPREGRIFLYALVLYNLSFFVHCSTHAKKHKRSAGDNHAATAVVYNTAHFLHPLTRRLLDIVEFKLDWTTHPN
jgi:hypothetical protein